MHLWHATVDAAAWAGSADKETDMQLARIVSCHDAWYVIACQCKCPFLLLPSALSVRLLWAVNQSIAHLSFLVVLHFTTVMSHKSTGQGQKYYVHLSAAA